MIFINIFLKYSNNVNLYFLNKVDLWILREIDYDNRHNNMKESIKFMKLLSNHPFIV